MNEIVGQRFCNSFGTWATVVEYKRAKDVTILFEYDQELTTEPIYGYNKAIQWLRVGEFRGPYCKTVNGLGYIGVGPYDTHKDSSRAHKIWTGMLSRASGESRLANPRMKSYWDVTVYEDWYNFQNFAEWYHKQVGADLDGWDLDKDLLSIAGESKIYSPNTCALLPREINLILPKKGGVDVAPQSLEYFGELVTLYQDMLSRKIVSKLKTLFVIGVKKAKKEAATQARLDAKFAKNELKTQEQNEKERLKNETLGLDVEEIKSLKSKETRLQKRRREIREYIKARHGK